jgi:hypothetical protein
VERSDKCNQKKYTPFSFMSVVASFLIQKKLREISEHRFQRWLRDGFGSGTTKSRWPSPTPDPMTSSFLIPGHPYLGFQLVVDQGSNDGRFATSPPNHSYLIVASLKVILAWRPSFFITRSANKYRHYQTLSPSSTHRVSSPKKAQRPRYIDQEASSLKQPRRGER